MEMALIKDGDGACEVDLLSFWRKLADFWELLCRRWAGWKSVSLYVIT